MDSCLVGETMDEGLEDSRTIQPWWSRRGGGGRDGGLARHLLSGSQQFVRSSRSGLVAGPPQGQGPSLGQEAGHSCLTAHDPGSSRRLHTRRFLIGHELEASPLYLDAIGELYSEPSATASSTTGGDAPDPRPSRTPRPGCRSRKHPTHRGCRSGWCDERGAGPGIRGADRGLDEWGIRRAPGPECDPRGFSFNPLRVRHPYHRDQEYTSCPDPWPRRPMFDGGDRGSYRSGTGGFLSGPRNLVFKDERHKGLRFRPAPATGCIFRGTFPHYVRTGAGVPRSASPSAPPLRSGERSSTRSTPTSGAGGSPRRRWDGRPGWTP